MGIARYLRNFCLRGSFPIKDLLSYDDKYKSENSKSKGMASAKRKVPADFQEKLKRKYKN